MPALASDLRKTLENTVVKARDLAERGARDALTALAVGASEPFSSMSDEERRLRNRLRAHGRQLGDQRDPQRGTQSIERLVREMAYEHWHRMLFARFLAENQLLIEPTSGVAISLDECEELAAEEGTDLWGLAAQFAQEMLPQIFRVDDPVLAAKLPLEIRQQLQGLLAGLEVEVFTASDSLGWTYQFWQAKRKKEVNDSGVKIGADELSPVTQLFTEDYMVDFLLDNTLGAWHASKVFAANPQLAASAESEDELRQAVSLPGCPWAYLRFIQTEEGAWTPAAGTFEGWPKTAAELKCLDPCMGSGHFVVAMFERLVALRLAEGNIDEATATEAVIKDNLFGLEIDPRCTQIAAFNLGVAAWRRVGYRRLIEINLACSGLAPNALEAEWLAIAGQEERLANGMTRLYKLFEKASVLGSLINPLAREADLLVAGFSEVRPLLDRALAQETGDERTHELSVTARGLAKAAEILASKFTLVATNVPYLARGKQHAEIQDYCEEVYPEAKTDLATCFVERCLAFCSTGGSASLVTPQNWLFLVGYKDLRLEMLKRKKWNFIARLGPKAFQTPMWDFNVMLTCISVSQPKEEACFAGIDVASLKSAEDKAQGIKSECLAFPSQSAQQSRSNSVVTFEEKESVNLLKNKARSFAGLQTGDNPKHMREFWEISVLTKGWSACQSSPERGRIWSGCSSIVRWSGNDVIRDDFLDTGVLRGREVWGRRAVGVGLMSKLPVAIYNGDLFSDNMAVLLPNQDVSLEGLYCFCESEDFSNEVRKINQKVAVKTQYLLNIPFEAERWQQIAASKYPSGLPKPFSSDPTQWLFNGHPADAEQPLHVAVARLVGYLWPRQTGSSFPDCPALQPDELNALADNDGIVCLSPSRGEAAASDRLRGLLSTAFGDEWSITKERELLLETAVAFDVKKSAPNLSDWLRQNFFAEHCKIFQSRPFIWQIWDGNPHGFSALVNYHKLAAPNGQGRKTLELLTFTYLGDWIDRQKLDQAEGVNGADDRLAAALDLQGQLKKILEGEPPYDVFVRWKPLHQQSIGWDPDINDGVRLNIRPFLKASLRKGGKKGAGILRGKPFEIKRKADRGKEPMRSKEGFPWFWGWDESDHTFTTDFGAPILVAPPAGNRFDGNRWNDLHYTRASKEAARARHRGDS
jgi:hypothetical protein